MRIIFGGMTVDATGSVLRLSMLSPSQQQGDVRFTYNEIDTLCDILQQAKRAGLSRPTETGDDIAELLG
ncbi:hypothetical protein ACFQXB_11675 [Plastorhodobacter daqingensis]|uniref:Uncharacterized protein n=1 Tax=Plastorhodobacter daqingensis TaxID=1387281 RepID=A0ABW2ULC2_9RHOB